MQTREARASTMRTVARTRILILAANPGSTTRLAIDEEVRAIEDVLRGAPRAIEVVTRWATRPDDLLLHMNAVRPHIVHFSMHGTERGELQFASGDGGSTRVDAATLAEVFGLFKDHGVEVVVLNACSSQLQAAAIAAKIPCVVGMAAEISDDAARVFSTGLYRAVGFGEPLRAAFEQGIAAIRLARLGEESTPQLFADGQAGTQAVGMSDRPVPVFVGFAAEDRGWFERLQTHLRPYLRGRPVDLWEVGKVAAGRRWREELERALTTTRVAILIVSAEFLGSDVIVEQQLPRLLAAEEGEQLVILPLIAGACAFAESELEKFTPLNDPGRPLAKLRKAELSEELVRVARAIDGVLRERMG